MNKQQIKSDDPSYFAMIPHLATDTMNPYQLALYTHYKRVAKENGSCFEGVRTTAKKTQMSVGKVVSTRDELVRDGWITVQYPEKDNDPKATIIIEVNSKWPENREYGESLKKRSYSEQSVHTVNTSIEPTVHVVNERIQDQEKETKNTKESAVAALGDTPDNSPENSSIKEDKKARKERLDQLFEIIALGSFGKPYAALNGQRGRAGEIRKLLLEENPDITPEYLKAGYARYFEANPTIKHDPSKRMKKASVIIDWCEQAVDCVTPVLLEPDKDCPKCRGLGYWIDKSNPNNHQSIDCECRSKQRVKS